MWFVRHLSKSLLLITTLNNSWKLLSAVIEKWNQCTNNLLCFACPCGGGPARPGAAWAGPGQRLGAGPGCRCLACAWYFVYIFIFFVYFVYIFVCFACIWNTIKWPSVMTNLNCYDIPNLLVTKLPYEANLNNHIKHEYTASWTLWSVTDLAHWCGPSVMTNLNCYDIPNLRVSISNILQTTKCVFASI